MITFVEYDDTRLCPCGSQKPYSACCKLKPLKWGYTRDGKLVQQIHMPPDFEEALKKTKQLFEEYYGRKPGKEDYVLSFAPIYQDEMLFDIMQAMQLAGIPPENIYAYYKTDGLLLCSLNDELVSKKDKEDFLNYCTEYRRAIEEPLTDSMNTLQFTALGNELLRAKNIGIARYNLEQQEKVQILSHLLSNYNDGRRKNFFCVAVNLLELPEMQEAIKQIQSNNELPSLPFKAQCLYVVEVFQKIADRRNIKLKLTKKK